MTKKEFEHSKIPVIEIFQSISGEGISAGDIVTFVRVGGCNLRCTWCDTKYSFAETGSDVKSMLPSEILDAVDKLGSNQVICTGGEPLEGDKSKRYVPAFLAANRFSIRIETSGASPLYTDEELKAFDADRAAISYCMDIKCPGSGMSERNLYENIFHLTKGDELKFVVQNLTDLQYSMTIIEKYKHHLSENEIALNFSPVMEAIHPVEIVEYLKENTAYFEENKLWPRLSLQLHKFVWSPQQRGV